MSQSVTKQQILDALKKEGINSIDDLAEEAAKAAQTKNLSASGKSPVYKSADVFVTIIVH